MPDYLRSGHGKEISVQTDEEIEWFEMSRRNLLSQRKVEEKVTTGSKDESERSPKPGRHKC